MRMVAIGGLLLVSATGAGAGTPQYEAQKQVLVQQFFACVTSRVVEIDDHASDASTIARGAVAVCGREANAAAIAGAGCRPAQMPTDDISPHRPHPRPSQSRRANRSKRGSTLIDPSTSPGRFVPDSLVANASGRSTLLVWMYPNVGHGLPRLGEPDHVRRRRVSRCPARPAFQCRLELPYWGVPRPADAVERDAGFSFAPVASDLQPG
jgi:hypothetical protein